MRPRGRARHVRRRKCAHGWPADGRRTKDGVVTSQAQKPSGLFITFEGGEGAGKTTHTRFLANALREHGHEVVCLREPGGTTVGEQLRAIVLDPANTQLGIHTELLIYEAARAQIVTEVIRPALGRGAVVLCDRFADSTIAYQVYGRGLPLDEVNRANEFACQGVWPDRTILMTTGSSAKAGLTRATRHHEADRLELAGAAFHERVNAGFARIAEEDPQRVRVVQSAQAKSQTSRLIFEQLADLFPWMRELIDGQPEYFAPLDKPKVHS